MYGMQYCLVRAVRPQLFSLQRFSMGPRGGSATSLSFDVFDVSVWGLEGALPYRYGLMFLML